jgi:phosphoribosylanthranilate isomerase
MAAVKVKICGLSEPRGLKAAIDYGAEFVGFVFYRRSPRLVTLEQAVELVGLVPRKITTVGLFVDPTDADLDTTLDHVQLDMLQLHGQETPERVAEIKRRTGLQIIKAVGISGWNDVQAATAYHAAADVMMFDAKPPAGATRPGGNAVSFDWTLLKPYTAPRPWFLAGGLARANVVAAIAQSGAPMVDVSSGVETQPGVKSPAKIRAFLAAVDAIANP